MFFRFNLLISLLVFLVGISVPASGQTKPDTISIASHNFKTGETSITAVSLTRTPQSTLPQIKILRGHSISTERGFQSNNFTESQLITSREDLLTFPNSAVVKIRLEYPDRKEGSGGSGMLISPRHVLTARHVILGGENNDIWPSKAYVYPAFSTNDDPLPFGESTGKSAFVFLEDPDEGNYDIGVIELDRPVGSLTNWVGIGGANDYGSLICYGDPFFTESQFYFAGYPGEKPFDGTTMRLWQGNFDYSSWHHLYLKNIQGPLRGESGSCAYTMIDNYPIVFGLLLGTTEYRSLCPPFLARLETHTRLDLNKFEEVKNFVLKSLNQASDLVPLDVRVGNENNPKHQAPVLYPGEPIEGLNVKIHNYSRADWSGDLKYEVYLSTNAELDPINDRLVSEGQGVLSIPSLGTGVLTTSQHFLPIDVGGENPGNLYYLGIRLITADSNTENNQTQQWDMMPVFVPRAKTLLNLVSEVTGKEKETISIPVTLLGSRYYKPIAGQTVQFFLDDQILGDGVTDDQGKAVLTYKLPKKSAGIKTLKVKYLGASAYEPAEASAELKIVS